MIFDEVSIPYSGTSRFLDQTNVFDEEYEKYVQWIYHKPDVVVKFVCPSLYIIPAL
jgi:hypothetical protein